MQAVIPCAAACVLYSMLDACYGVESFVLIDARCQVTARVSQLCRQRLLPAGDVTPHRSHSPADGCRACQVGASYFNNAL
jgi:hypothetical protein